MIHNKTIYTLLCFMALVNRFCLAGVLQNPGNVSCIFHYQLPQSPNTLICNWTPSKETNLDADYTCIRKPDAGVQDERILTNYSCTFHDVPLLSSYCIYLKAPDPFGTSKCTHFHSAEILKPDPPQLNELEPVPGMKQMLRVSWTGPQKLPRSTKYVADRQYEIRYTATTKNHSSTMFVPGNQTSINLTNLLHCTNYTVAVRCHLNGSKFWSEWSNVKTGTTEEPDPLKVDLWRVIELHPSSGNRTVHLLWKENEEFQCSGKMNNYEIRYSTENNTYFEHTKGNTFTLHLTEEAYVISVAAFNVTGESPVATVKIPSVSEEHTDHQRIVTLNASALNEQIILEWEPSDLDINGYVIEWYNDLEPNSYKRSWQKITNVTKWTFPKGAFIPFKRYKISVYPLLNGEIKVPSSTRTYFREGIPLEGPSVEPAENIDKNRATIKWKEIPEAKRNGIIISYTVFYKSEDGKELGETVNANVLHYQLKSLQANTKYEVHVMASTVAGGKNGSVVVFVTTKLGAVDIILISILLGLFMLCLLIVGILGAVKRHKLKRILWPPIPHPSITTTTTQKLPVWKNSPMEETHNISLEAYPCSEKCDKLQLPNHENFITQKIIPDNVCGREYEVIIGLPTISSVERDSKSPDLRALNESSNDYENIEDQSHLNKAFNPYFKNSVSKREFLMCENSAENTHGPKLQSVPLTFCLPNSTACPYVPLDKFAQFREHTELQDT
ncbi:interleukin-31 receptor subunit alpha [Pogona vitticeps]